MSRRISFSPPSWKLRLRRRGRPLPGNGRLRLRNDRLRHHSVSEHLPESGRRGRPVHPCSGKRRRRARHRAASPGRKSAASAAATQAAGASPIRIHAPPILIRVHKTSRLVSGSSQSQSGSFSSFQSVSSNPQNLPLTFDPRCGTTVANVNRSPIAFSGGGEISHMIALGPYWVAGVAVDVSGSGMNASGTQTGTKVVAGTPINETFSTNQRQAFTTTYRASIGVVAFPNILIFLTGGGATGKVSGNLAYTAVQPSGGPASVASGSGSWSETRTGYSLGGGVTFAYPVVLGGRITVEYLYTNLGTVNRLSRWCRGQTQALPWSA